MKKQVLLSTYSLTKEIIASRYPQSRVSLFWAVFQPVMMLCLYSFIFGIVFNVRWSTEIDNIYSFALVLFLGLIFHNCLVENIMSGATLFSKYGNGIKKMNLSPHMLVIAQANANFAFLLLNFAVFFVCFLFLIGPVLLDISVALATFGVFYLFNILVVYLSSIFFTFSKAAQNLLNIVPLVLIFISPVLYPISAVPEQFRGYLYWNPMTLIIQNIRSSFFVGVDANPFGLLILAGLCCFSFLSFRSISRFFLRYLPDVI